MKNLMNFRWIVRLGSTISIFYWRPKVSQKSKLNLHMKTPPFKILYLINIGRFVWMPLSLMNTWLYAMPSKISIICRFFISFTNPIKIDAESFDQFLNEGNSTEKLKVYIYQMSQNPELTNFMNLSSVIKSIKRIFL